METASIMLEQEFDYYVENQADLVKKYKGKFLVIKGKEVVDAYDSIEQAYQESLKKHEEGTFLIQECEPGEDNYTQTFHSRVIFNE